MNYFRVRVYVSMPFFYWATVRPFVATPALRFPVCRWHSFFLLPAGCWLLLFPGYPLRSGVERVGTISKDVLFVYNWGFIFNKQQYIYQQMPLFYSFALWRFAKQNAFVFIRVVVAYRSATRRALHLQQILA